MRNEREIETATDIVMQLQYLGSESLDNLLHSVIAEIGRKGGFLKGRKSLASFAVKYAPIQPDFCQDEGCPQFGIKHICVTKVRS